MPITSSKVSYGFPEIDNNTSFGLKRPNNVKDKACVPEIISLLTRASSAFKTSLNTFSVVSLPKSSYPYPVVELKCDSDISFFIKAFSTFLLFISSILSIRENSSFRLSSALFIKSIILL